VEKIAALLEKDPTFTGIRASAELGVVKCNFDSLELSILASGRVVVKKAPDEDAAKRVIESLAPVLKQSLF
jgi:hypothetical protein